MRCVILLLLVLTLSGCSNNWYLGEWTVTDAKFPGISAIGMEEAREWFGSEAMYSTSSMTFRGETCAAPRFKVEALTEADFRVLYRATFAALGIENESVEILDVGCPSESAHPGSMLIKVTRDVGYIPWDGVFFRVDRKVP